MKKEDFEKEILEKLDIIIKLLSYGPVDRETPQTESILRLRKIGLRPTQIADILGTSSNYVNVVLSTKKEKKKNE